MAFAHRFTNLGGALAFTLASAFAMNASACERQVGQDRFGIFDDGEVYAENEPCNLGDLWVFYPQSGQFEKFIGDDNRPVRAHDIKGVQSKWGTFIVVLLENYAVAMRYGQPTIGFFGRSDVHSAFYAQWDNGQVLTANAIEDVKIEADGEISVYVQAGDSIYVSTTDANGYFSNGWVVAP